MMFVYAGENEYTILFDSPHYYNILNYNISVYYLCFRFILIDNYTKYYKRKYIFHFML